MYFNIRMLKCKIRPLSIARQMLKYKIRPARPMLIGLIADTHGLMRPEAVKALNGVDVILHAGDVGGSAVLDALWAVAPVHAVRGTVVMADAELRDALAGLSPTVARLADDVTAATSPGQAYLLGRKLEAARKDELQRVSREVAGLALDRLSGSSVAAVEEPFPTPSGDHAGVAILNAAFLVAQARLDEFRAVVTDLMRDYGDRGFRIEFTGPWPPYHFTRSGAAGDSRQARVTS